MFTWPKNLFLKKCPQCGSTHIRDRTGEVMTVTYNLYYECGDCKYQWKESGL